MSSRSKLGRLSASGFGPVSDTVPGAARLFFKEWDHGCSTKLLDTGDATGGHGSLDHMLEHYRVNQTVVKPSGTLRPSVGEWSYWLAALFDHDAVAAGAGPVVQTFVPQTASLFFNVHFDTDASRRTYLAAGCTLSKATVKCESKAAVELDVEIEGRTYTEAVAFAGAVAPANYNTRFVMADEAVVLNNVATRCKRVSLSFDNGIDNDRFFFGLASAGPLKTDRVIAAELEIPFGLHSALWDDGVADAGIPLTVTFSYGANNSLAFTFPTCRADADAFRSVVPREDFFTLRLACLANFTGPGAAAGAVLTVPAAGGTLYEVLNP